MKGSCRTQEVQYKHLQVDANHILYDVAEAEVHAGLELLGRAVHGADAGAESAQVAPAGAAATAL